MIPSAALSVVNVDWLGAYSGMLTPAETEVVVVSSVVVAVVVAAG